MKMNHYSIVLFVLSFIGFWLLVNFLPTFHSILVKSLTVFVAVFVSSVVSKFLEEKIFDEKLSAENKAVFITGCDSGFGYELTKRLDVLGYKVFAGCLDPKGKGALDLTEKCSSKVEIIPIDVRSDDSIEDARNNIVNNLKGNVLWAVVNNAGIVQCGEMDWACMEDIRNVYEVNTFGTIKVTKAFLPLLKASRGRVVNNTSAVGRFICPGFVGYCMSKSATIAFTEGLRVEMLKWGVKVIGIEPFFYKTPLTTLETAIRTAQSAWDKVDPNSRQVYGEDYFESFKYNCRHTADLGSSKVYEVIDCFEKAITLKEADCIYFPAYLPHKLGILISRILPTNLVDGYKRLYLDCGEGPAALKK